jgi:hypothetical protein
MGHSLNLWKQENSTPGRTKITKPIETKFGTFDWVAGVSTRAKFGWDHMTGAVSNIWLFSFL